MRLIPSATNLFLLSSVLRRQPGESQATSGHYNAAAPQRSPSAFFPPPSFFPVNTRGCFLSSRWDNSFFPQSMSSNVSFATSFICKVTTLDGTSTPALIGYGNACGAQEEGVQAMSAYRTGAQLFLGWNLDILLIAQCFNWRKMELSLDGKYLSEHGVQIEPMFELKLRY